MRLSLLLAVIFPAAAATALAQTALPEKGHLQPASATYSVGAGGGSVTIQVTRTVGSSGTVGCSYATVNGTAIAGTDYTAVSGTLSWSGGDATARSVSIPIFPAGAGRSFSFRLSNPTGGAFLGVPVTSPRTNHEGRVLGTTPAITNVHWHTAQADAVISTLQVLPANNPWNEDIRSLPVLGNSATMINNIGAGTSIALNRDMNYVFVPSNQAKKNVTLVDYADESDPGPYPVPNNAPIEGWPVDDPRTLDNSQLDSTGEGGDRHTMIVDPSNGFFYEFWQMVRNSSYAWTASNEATFNLNSNQLRPDGWTSGDAAGLPIFPAAPRYDECERGMVEHALRFTVQISRSAYVWPATHEASSNTSVDRPRMGERFRLKNSSRVNGIINGMAKHPKAIALALQKYGMFMADNGGNWRISAGADPRLTNLSQLTQLIGSDFEVVQPTGPNGGPRQYSSAVVSITGGGGDATAPAIAIGTPTTASTYSTSTTPIALGGTASDNVGVSSVTWSNAAGGGSGTASGTTSWSASIPLLSGSNVITVTARDAAGNATSDSITVTYTPGDTTPPAIAITSPTSGSSTSTSSTPIALGGTASDTVGVTTVTWSNGATGGNGTATGTTSWSASVSLAAGGNVVTVTARDAAGNSTSDSITVTYTPPAGDATPPTIATNSPTTSATWTATSTPLTVAGTAGDNVGVSTVTWSNATNGASGSASGTTSWSATVPLAAGSNSITIRAFDSAGNSTSDLLTVDFSSGGGGGGKSGGGGGGCGLIGLEILAVWFLRSRKRRDGVHLGHG